ncbi:MAG: hypothetical protein M2R45_02928 [Verrucomicrobia subdivision 3 bacterium]|nr:hypothetical protein [Limisphaerales bacterium]MCS1415351.1 hypothetical protein [Limisphaerales bacterium]
MDKEEAKYLLQSYRPSGRDAEDPHFAEALSLARIDPELQSWFFRQQEGSKALSEKFQEIPVPKDLKARILMGKLEHQVQHRWAFKHTLAIAVAVLLLLTPIAFYLNRFEPAGPKTYAALKLDMGNYLSRFFVLEMQSEDPDEIREYLKSKHGFANFKIPAALAKHPGIGCQMIDWHDQEVALICFDIEQEVVHLFILGPMDAEDAPTSVIPKFEQVDRWATFTWSEAERSYFVSTLGDRSYLKRVMDMESYGSF